MQAKSRSMLVAVLVTSAIALLASWASDHAVLLGLLIVGPLLAAASLDGPGTAIVGLYALGLAVLVGISAGIVGTSDHLLGCLVVATGGALGPPGRPLPGPASTSWPGILSPRQIYCSRHPIHETG